MDAGIVGVAGTLLGVLVGGLLTHWNATAQAKLGMRWQHVRLIQEKLKEIAQVLDQIELHYMKRFSDILLKVESDQPLEISGERIPIARLKILIEFYAPELLQDLGQLEKLRDDFGEILIEAIPKVSRTKLENQELNGRVARAEGRISAVCQSMGSKAALLAQKAVGKQTG